MYKKRYKMNETDQNVQPWQVNQATEGKASRTDSQLIQ